MSERFTSALWGRIEPIYRAILGHPFLRGLTDGTLPRERFRFYVVQDALYLREFARALGLAAAKSPEDETIAMFCRHGAGTIEVERSLHEGFLRELGSGWSEVDSTPPAPTCLAYTSYLVRVAYEAPFAELVGAVLPCYWIYWEVGRQLVSRGSPDNLYRRWIEAYAGEAFGELVRAVLGIADDVALRSTAAQREVMATRFVTASRYEWMFWDMAWRMEQWPV